MNDIIVNGCQSSQWISRRRTKSWVSVPKSRIIPDAGASRQVRRRVMLEKTYIRCPRDPGLMGARLRAPLKPHNEILLWCTAGFRGASIEPHDVSLSDTYTSDHRCFPVWWSCVRAYVAGFPSLYRYAAANSIKRHPHGTPETLRFAASITTNAAIFRINRRN